jgi:hypothetical protein
LESIQLEETVKVVSEDALVDEVEHVDFRRVQIDAQIVENQKEKVEHERLGLIQALEDDGLGEARVQRPQHGRFVRLGVGYGARVGLQVGEESLTRPRWIEAFAREKLAPIARRPLVEPQAELDRVLVDV